MDRAPEGETTITSERYEKYVKKELALYALADACYNEGHEANKHSSCFICQALFEIKEQLDAEI